MHVPVAGPVSSMGVNFMSQETAIILYSEDEFVRDFQCSVSVTGIAVVPPRRGAALRHRLPGTPWWAFLCQDRRAPSGWSLGLARPLAPLS